jgi:hypothetical protein
MTTRKTSVSLTEDALAAATAAAAEAGVSVSAWLSRAAIDQAWRDRAITAADELYRHAVEASGPLSPADEDWVAQTLADTVGDSAPSAVV